MSQGLLKIESWKHNYILLFYISLFTKHMLKVNVKHSTMQDNVFKLVNVSFYEFRVTLMREKLFFNHTTEISRRFLEWL